MEARGIRNHNPLNIEKSKDKWQGMAEKQIDKRFVMFKDPTYGIRAGARILIKYQDDYNLRTIKAILKRFAPPVENDTGAYAKRVSKLTGFAVDEVLNLHTFDHLFPLIKAMIEVECGKNPYSDAVVTKGLVLAGVEPKEPNLSKTRTMTAVTVASAATVAQPVADMMTQVTEHAGVLQSFLSISPFILALIALAFLGYIAYARWDDRRKGLR